MESSLSVVHSLLKDKDINSSCFNNVLTFVDECQLLNFAENSNVQEIVSLINTALHNSQSDRLRALQVLGKCSKQCTDEVFTSNAILWMQHCTQWSPQTVNVELKILNHLIVRSVGNPDLKKQINSIIIPRIVERLNNCSSTAKSTVVLKLICLRSLVDGYSSSCSPSRTQLYKYIISTLKNYSEYDEIISPAARCLVLLHSCGSAGQQGINYKERWTSQFHACISTYHKLLDQLYGDIEQMKIGTDRPNETTFDDFLELKQDYRVNPSMRYFGLRRSCSVLTSMIQSMLLCKFPVGKSFNIRDTMNLVCRIVSVTPLTLQDESLTNDIIALGVNLPYLHLCAFELLQALIICAKRNLIVHSTLICKLCIQSLKWISSVARAKETIIPFKELRRKAYHALSTWLAIAGSCSSVEVFADELVPLLISSIECRKQGVTLLLDQQKKRGKRKRGQFSSEISMNTEAANSSRDVSDEGVCCLAHNTLQLMLRNASIFIKWELHKTIQTVIVNQLLDIQKCSKEQEYPAMYSDSKCRLMLYGSLLTILTEPHPKWCAPTSYAVNIFNAGINDSQIEITTFCKFAIAQLETLNHPRAPTLQFGSEPLQNIKPSADVERLLAVNASLSKSIEIPSISNTLQVSEKLVEVLKSNNQTDKVSNPTSSIVKQKLPMETDHLQAKKLTENVTDEKLTVESSSISTEDSKTGRSDSPLPKKLKLDDSHSKTKEIGKDKSSSKISVVDDSSTGNESIGSTSKIPSAKEPITENNLAGRSSLWPEEDADVDIMLKDFVDEV